jgi:predicted nucleic acid-binding protein
VEDVAVARFVIDGGATLELASAAVEVSPAKELYAPTLWRSETLSAVYEAVRRGELDDAEARAHLAYVNALKIRLLGDAVLRRRAWEIARQLDLATTYQAEYVALAQLQKCTLVSLDASFLKRVGDLVPTAPVQTLT